MAGAIRVLGETFQQALDKTVGADYKSCGNTYWPKDERDVAEARNFNGHRMRGFEEESHDMFTAADYEFQTQKGFILGPPQACQAGSREEMIKAGYVGVYYKQPTPQ